MNFITLSQATNLSPVAIPTFTEMYAAFYEFDATLVSISATSPGTSFLVDNGSNSALYTLNSKASTLQKYAFECTLACQLGGTTVNAALWDTTTNSIVSASQVSSTTTTFARYRSNQFTLTPGHTYAVTLWRSAGSSGNTQATSANIVIFGQ